MHLGGFEGVPFLSLVVPPSQMVVTLDGVVPNGWKSLDCTFLDIVRSILSFLSVNMSGSLVTIMGSSSGSALSNSISGMCVVPVVVSA